MILYGDRSDWVRNALAGGAQVVRRGRTCPLVAPHLAGPDAPGISARARLFGRVSGELLVAGLGPPEPGFGRGPRAG